MHDQVVDHFSGERRQFFGDVPVEIERPVDGGAFGGGLGSRAAPVLVFFPTYLMSVASAFPSCISILAFRSLISYKLLGPLVFFFVAAVVIIVRVEVRVFHVHTQLAIDV